MKKQTAINWAKQQFNKYRGSVAFVETKDKNLKIGMGTCFHVGEGVFITASHVLKDQTIIQIGFDDEMASPKPLYKPEPRWSRSLSSIAITDGPFFHADESIDVACFKCEFYPKDWIPLGGHFDDMMGHYELVMHRVLLLGYPPIPLSNRPVLLASVGEVNASIEKYTGGHPHFIVSTMARGGFSGGPALVAYNERNEDSGTAALGLVTEALIKNDQAAELGYMTVLTVEPIYDCLKQNNLLPSCQEPFREFY